MDIETKWKKKLLRMDEKALASLGEEIELAACDLENVINNKPRDQEKYDGVIERIHVLKNVAGVIVERIYDGAKVTKHCDSDVELQPEEERKIAIALDNLK